MGMLQLLLARDPLPEGFNKTGMYKGPILVSFFIFPCKTAKIWSR